MTLVSGFKTRTVLVVVEVKAATAVDGVKLVVKCAVHVTVKCKVTAADKSAVNVIG